MNGKENRIQGITQRRDLPARSISAGIAIWIVCITILLISSPVAAAGDISQNVTINPIGTHAVGDTFDISGSCMDPNPDVFIMIHPTKNYEEIKRWVMETKDPQFSFSIECDGTEEGAPGNITRYYADGRSESRTVPMPINRLYPDASVTSGSDGSSWKTTINGTNFLGAPLKPDSYSITVMAAGKGDDPFYGAADATFTLT